jgi:hypothetical protein
MNSIGTYRFDRVVRGLAAITSAFRLATVERRDLKNIYYGASSFNEESALFDASNLR